MTATPMNSTRNPADPGRTGSAAFYGLASLIAVFVMLASNQVLAERQWNQNRSIEQVSEHVYRWGSDNQYGAYIVGENSIAVVDGHYCQTNTVAWVKEEIAKRHDVPVRYLILSHDHQDHNCNSQMFSDTATAVGHKNIVGHMVREQRNSAIPEITFDKEMRLDLGGVAVDLLYFGPSHSDNLIQVHIPQDKVLIAVDMAKGRSLFPDYRDMDVNSTLDVMRILGNLEDVDVVLPGHGPIVNQDAFSDGRKYITALRDRVLELMVDGKTLNEMRDLIKMEEFSDYRGHDLWMDHNIVTMWEYVYRYREPNERITQDEARDCRVDLEDCRTGPLTDDPIFRKH